MLSIPPGATVHGAPGARPVVNFTTSTPGSDGFFLQSGSTLRDVIATSSSSQMNLIDVIGGTVERVNAHSSGGGSNTYACAAGQGAVYRDSVCWFSGLADTTLHTNSALAAFSQVNSDSVTLRNVTAYAPNGHGLQAVSAAGHSVTVNASNLIANGGDGDVRTQDFGGTGETVNLDHSNYATEIEDAGPITNPNTGTNTNVAPMFVDATNGDFRETAASTGTIDLGTADGLLPGELDVLGMTRSYGVAPDIGAYEYVPTPPAAPSGSPPPVGQTPVVPKKKCKKKKKHRAGAAKKCKRKKK